MTEQEWLNATDPKRMLGILWGKTSDRKLRLFAIACCRRIWQLLPDKRSRRAVEVAERYSDSQATEQELEFASGAACSVWDEERTSISGEKPDEEDDYCPRTASLAAYNVAIPIGWWGAAPAFVAPDEIAREVAADSGIEAAAHCDLLRDIFDNPFRPITVNPCWLSPKVVNLAQVIYDERGFDRLPSLANVLEEAGCTNADILAHCQGPGPHVRGCWAVDLLLGKE